MEIKPLTDFKSMPPFPVKPTRKYFLPVLMPSIALLFDTPTLVSISIVAISVMYYLFIRHNDLRSYSFSNLQLGYYFCNEQLRYTEKNKKIMPKIFDDDEHKREWEELTKSHIWINNIKEIEQKYSLLKLKPYRNQVYDTDLSFFDK